MTGGVRVELRVKLEPPGRRAHGERVVGVAGTRAQQPGTGRKLEDGFHVGRLDPQRTREAPEQRVVACRVAELDVDGPDLAPPRIHADAPSQTMGQELMAVTDTQHRRPRTDGGFEPRGGPLAPGLALRHHGTGPGDDDSRQPLGCRQWLRFADARDRHRLGREAQTLPNPVLIVTGALEERRQLAAGLDDE